MTQSMSAAEVLSNRRSWAILHGDALTTLKALPSDSVSCCVTSPPYFALRDYGVEGQIGLERTPAEFVAVMVEVFREVRRVLHPSGTCWINLGDSYSGAGYSRQSNTGGAKREQGGKQRHTPAYLGPKQLLMMPARVAIALQDDGWVLRSEIIWHKVNPMPESVTDRPTKAHEQIYLFAKSARYYYDADAIREPHAEPWRGQGERESDTPHSSRLDGDVRGLNRQPVFVPAVREYNPLGRNSRDVWSIPSEPFPAAHFAVFPTELPRRCIAAGSSEHGVCAACGAPWRRFVERETNWQERRAAGAWAGNVGVSATYQNGVHGAGMSHDLGGGRSTFLGWQPSCKCGAGILPSVVLDPFSGAGTTALVALRLGRRALGVELNGSYVQISRNRIMADAPLFNALEVAV